MNTTRKRDGMLRCALVLCATLCVIACDESSPSGGSDTGTLDATTDSTTTDSTTVEDTTEDTAVPDTGGGTDTTGGACTGDGECGVNEVCDSGTCVCAEGWSNCPELGSGCTTDLSALDNCGTTCDDWVSCYDINNVDGLTCENGSCGYADCAAGFSDCITDDPQDGSTLGCETDILNEVANCGGCGGDFACSADGDQVQTVTCTEGACTVETCAENYGDCDGELSNGCELLLNDLDNCGACGNVCDTEDQIPDLNVDPTQFTCENFTCEVESCFSVSGVPVFDDCDQDPANGCETLIGEAPAEELGLSSSLPEPFSTNASEHCAGCNIGCGPGADCISGECTPIAQVAAGDGFTCALRAPSPIRSSTSWSSDGGFVLCWGKNDKGQLGNGTKQSPTREAQLVLDADTGTYLDDVVHIAAGREHACAVLSDGSAKCWGAAGPWLGFSGLSDHAVEAQQVSGLTNAVFISAGAQHTCALNTSKEVYCWGNNDRGQCGSDPTVFHPINAPRRVVTNFDAESLDSGEFHNCIVDTTTSTSSTDPALCWGDNTVGQLGNGSVGGFEFRLQEIPGLVAPRSLSLGANHSCLVQDNVGFDTSEVLCWGDGSRGQNGSNSTLSKPSLVRVATETVRGANIVALAGGDNTCGIKADGTFACVGDNSGGILGTNPITLPESSSPQELDKVPASLTQIDIGMGHACYVLDGLVSCWGDNSSGQLGDPANTSTSSTSPQQVSDL